MHALVLAEQVEPVLVEVDALAVLLGWHIYNWLPVFQLLALTDAAPLAIFLQYRDHLLLLGWPIVL